MFSDTAIFALSKMAYIEGQAHRFMSATEIDLGIIYSVC
jgi:hypothetical protein